MQTKNCIICNSTEQGQVFQNVKDLEYKTYQPVNYISCKNCGLIFQHPAPQNHLLPTFYPREYRNYLPSKNGFFSTLKSLQFHSLARKISRYINKNSKILEIGCGSAQLLLAFKQLGYEKLYGSDFTNKAFPDVKEKGIKLKASNIEYSFPFNETNETFDVIIMNNVFEHFLNPVQVIQNCKNNLSNNGKIILITPNTKALEFALFKSYWAGFHAPRHTFLFNDKNIKLLSKNLRFSSVKVEPISDPGQWSISIQNILQDKNLTKTKLKNGIAWYLTSLSLFFSPITICQNLIGRSTSMMCILEG